MSEPQSISVRPWQWPPAIMTMSELFAAMRAGFELQLSYYESNGRPKYTLVRDGEPAPLGVLRQAVAAKAHQLGKFGHPIQFGKETYLLKLTTKSTGDT